jgi:hypothetical protein
MKQKGNTLMAWLVRPRDPSHPECARELSAAKEEGDELPPIEAYVRCTLSNTTVKKELAATNNLCKGKANRKDLQRKRSLLCGSDFPIDRFVDLFEGLSDVKMAILIEELTPSQEAIFTNYLRKLPNGIGLLHGAFGSGKTLLIKRIAGAYSSLGKRLLILAAANGPADTAAYKTMEDKSLMVIRVYSTSKRCYMLSQLIISLTSTRS